MKSYYNNEIESINKKQSYNDNSYKKIKSKLDRSLDRGAISYDNYKGKVIDLKNDLSDSRKELDKQKKSLIKERDISLSRVNEELKYAYDNFKYDQGLGPKTNPLPNDSNKIVTNIPMDIVESNKLSDDDLMSIINSAKEEKVQVSSRFQNKITSGTMTQNIRGSMKVKKNISKINKRRITSTSLKYK